MYKWPQGKILRIILLLLAAAMGADLGFTAYGKISVALAEETLRYTDLAVGGVLALLGAVVVFGGGACLTFVTRTVDWIIEVEEEMKRVTWPQKNEIIRSTVMITIVTVVLAALIFLFDWINIQVVVNGILRRGVL